MKKFFSFFCAVITAISLTSCGVPGELEGGSSDDTPGSPDVSSSDPVHSDNSDSSISSYTPYPDDSYDENDPIPHIDGSTSAIPLNAGLRSGFLGISYAKAKEMVYHTTTHESFKRLINGDVDLIFSVRCGHTGNTHNRNVDR